MHVTNIDCRGGQAALRTAGGPVTIDSLDGNCVIESQGGNVQASCTWHGQLPGWFVLWAAKNAAQAMCRVAAGFRCWLPRIWPAG